MKDKFNINYECYTKKNEQLFLIDYEKINIDDNFNFDKEKD
jgi:hypothetical protein